jgi:dephospho-CoA kinase
MLKLEEELGRSAYSVATVTGMKLIGLGGGIGSGKSTVSLMLAERGAVIVDADVIARNVVEPGGPCLSKLVERFGLEIVDADGKLIRPALANKVFGFPEELAALNAITHPAINAQIADEIAVHADTDRIVILDAALSFNSRRDGMVGRMVVDVDPKIAIARLMEFRGFSEADARVRVASQQSREDRVAAADFVIDNSGDVSALQAQVQRAWEWISNLRPSP